MPKWHKLCKCHDWTITMWVMIQPGDVKIKVAHWQHQLEHRVQIFKSCFNADNLSVLPNRFIKAGWRTRAVCSRSCSRGGMAGSTLL
jgi:hypothetical protein